MDGPEAPVVEDTSCGAAAAVAAGGDCDNSAVPPSTSLANVTTPPPIVDVAITTERAQLGARARGAGAASAREMDALGSARMLEARAVGEMIDRTSCCWIILNKPRDNSSGSGSNAKLEAAYTAATTLPSYAAAAAAPCPTDLSSAHQIDEKTAAVCAFRLAQRAHATNAHAAACAWLAKGLEHADPDDANCAIAQHNLAYMLDSGVNGPRDIGAAIKLYVAAGLAHSLFRVGLILAQRVGVSGVSGSVTPADVVAAERATKFIETAARAGHAEASLVAGAELLRGRMRAADDAETHARGMEHLLRASRCGLASADYEIALVHMARWCALAELEIDITAAGAAKLAIERDGRTKEEIDMAFEAMQRGAERGNAACQELLGRAFVRGQGCTVDRKQALAWLIRAGENGAPSAAFDAARMIQNGIGMTTKSVPRALAMYERLVAEHAHLGAMMEIVNILRTGSGRIKANPTRAMELLDAAAALDYIPAVVYLLREKMVLNEGDSVNRYKTLVSQLAGVASTPEHQCQEAATHALVDIGELTACAWCKKTGPFSDGRALRACSRCGRVRYCQFQCQRDAWPEHKGSCIPLSDTVAANLAAERALANAKAAATSNAAIASARGKAEEDDNDDA